MNKYIDNIVFGGKNLKIINFGAGAKQTFQPLSIIWVNFLL